MEKIFTLADEKRGIVQITTDDERFYVREGKDEKTGLPIHVYKPSVTWIVSYAPKGIGYYKWLAEHGWDEAESIKKERGKYGSRVHKAVESLLNGEKIEMNTEFADPYTGELQSLTFQEYDAVLSFADWWAELNTKHDDIEIIEIEHTIWNEQEDFAGTIDLILRIDGEYWIIDFKTSKYIWMSHEMQVSAYRHSIDFGDAPVRTAILQLGYNKNKKNYKFTETEDRWTQFLAAREFWRIENDGKKPFQKDYPLFISLNLPVAQMPAPLPKTKTKKNAKNK